MFRRKTRNSTAYTGVGHSSPSSQAPDNGAMAAALSIGQTLRETRPDVYGKPASTLLMSKHQQPKPTLSLLKRSSSIQNSMGPTSTPRQSRTGLNLSNRHSMAAAGDRHVYNVDDSFNDSFFEEVGREADVHYSNEMQLQNLKLRHTPQVAQPKMVKKYIPTPNGITVVEVPEETMKKDIARSNSMRSNLSLKRSGLLVSHSRSHSMANSARARKPNRVSSLASQSRIDEQTEDDYHSRHMSPVSHASREHEELHKQIEHEKQLARDLERQRAEYEQLKLLRLENERKLMELHSLQEEDTSSFRAVSSIDEKELLSNDTTASDRVKPNGASAEHEDGSEDEEDGSEDEEDGSEDEEDVPIAPLPFVVDELDLKKAGASEQNGKPIDGALDLHLDKQIDPASPQHDLKNSGTDIPISHDDAQKSAGLDGSVDNFGIEEVPTESFESPNLASQLRPNFFGAFPEESGMSESAPSSGLVPEITETHETTFDHANDLHNDGLVPPPNFAGSIRSFSSVDSKSRPIKSAMKNARPAYSSNNSLTASPAHQAYLSLTTAENTRLNSKLSSPNLEESLAPEVKPQAPKSPNHQLKRMSQSLRKQPSGASQNGLSGRSLRPQSVIDGQLSRGQSGAMRASKPVVQPIPPHPVTKPNYQSPSKLKAAELYAKANKRPMSYQALPRTSSFTRESAAPQKPSSQVPQKSAHRMTLRSPPVASSINPVDSSIQNAQTQTYSQQHSGSGNHVSKFVDSDDEHDTRGSKSHGFLSRFVDSDDETPRHLTSQRPIESSPIKTLRNKEGKKKEKEEFDHKEKKPKKKFLKKLFGRS
ncbi:hypothetical protein METBIDRAFT_37841 [Metschnikowia bicuspidata var. bicuspidata NRRL YB-4993]|uniref:Uncharacterized protein n=1 Tax=Metschnikowia bicuspidata var. bicuspidata NRRL YB-4993 TaxID=869754 RepID=A0A1A0HK31_9ASCO|nr:hypothetical protein METBIDRAFT_37841 [Metschnikowia bicuspidata var. bicuspidata NRRL YB-4993]OBA24380.1 hypothetical protein METBIDRAFT_37841 [Metschnikowia bicuspidata var. bicuspidata NRRL YB-4993]